MSNSTNRDIATLKNADPEAIMDIIRLLEKKVRPPVIANITDVTQLADEKHRIQTAYDAGRASIVSELKSTYEQITEDS